MILLRTYTRAMPIPPASISLKVSAEKVENVLNPPQKPVIINNLRSADHSFSAELESIYPSNKQAIRLAIKVAQGKPSVYGNNLLTPYRAILPAPPPINT